MLIQEIREIKSGRKELRQFGLLFAFVLSLIGLWIVWKEEEIPYLLFLISGIFLSLGFGLPVSLKPFHKVWMSFAVLLGFVMTCLILVVVYYLVFTPMGLVSRLFGYSFLNTKWDGTRQSYWNSRSSSDWNKNNCKRQF